MISPSRAGAHEIQEARIRRAPDVLFRRSGSATILARLRGTSFHGLEGPASLAWELLEEDSLDELARRLVGRYPAMSSWVDRQLPAVIRELLSLGLVVRVDPG